MTKPLILFPDPQLATRDLLRTLLASRSVPATVSTRDAPTDDGAARPWVRVSSDPTQRSGAAATATVRLAVYAGDVGASMALAALCEGLLLAEASSFDVRSFGPITGPVAGTDPDTGEPLAYVSIAARLRPRQL